MTREVDIPQIGRVVLTKRRASRHIRLRVSHDGVPHVSLPYWVPYASALHFISSKVDWIQSQQKGKVHSGFHDGQRIGKAHTLRIIESDTIRTSTRLKGNEAIVYVAPQRSEQAAAKRVILRALESESEALLPQRLAMLAKAHGFSYSKTKIGRMRSRWGSCNTEKLITLSCYLIQLPWHLIDYVLLHELVHTEVMAHDKAFWKRLESVLPEAKLRRKELKNYHPSILTTQP